MNPSNGSLHYDGRRLGFSFLLYPTTKNVIPVHLIIALGIASSLSLGNTAHATPALNKLTAYMQAEDLYEQGFNKIKMQNYQEAIASLDLSLQLNPAYAPAYISRGFARLALTDHQGAIQDYTRAISIEPKLAEAYVGRGDARQAIGDQQGAIDDFNQALQIDPKNSEAYYNRGIVQDSLGDEQRAIVDFSQAIRTNSGFAEAYANRGIVRLRLGQQEGLKDLHRAASLFLSQGDRTQYQQTLDLIKNSQ